MGEAAWDKLFLTDPTLSDETVMEGSDLVGGRIRCLDEQGKPTDRQVLLTVGGENDLMPVGLHRHLGDTVASRKQAMGADTPDAVRAFHAAQGLVPVSYPHLVCFDGAGVSGKA